MATGPIDHSQSAPCCAWAGDVLRVAWVVMVEQLSGVSVVDSLITFFSAFVAQLCAGNSSWRARLNLCHRAACGHTQAVASWRNERVICFVQRMFIACCNHSDVSMCFFECGYRGQNPEHFPLIGSRPVLCTHVQSYTILPERPKTTFRIRIHFFVPGAQLYFFHLVSS